MKTEIWIGGRLLCKTENEEAIRDFERIVRKAGYEVNEKEEDGKIIKMV
jgi:TusA-related sulfurtransferase